MEGEKTMIKELQKVYQKETGKKASMAYYDKDSKAPALIYFTPEYVRWLEDKVSKPTMPSLDDDYPGLTE